MIRNSLLVFLTVPALVLAQASPVETTASQPAAPKAAEDTYTWLGPVLAATLDTSDVGDALLGELGAQVFSLRHDDQRWLVLWDGVVALKGGVLGNSRPYTSMLGARAQGNVEVAYRFANNEGWSPYLSGKAGANLQILGHPGLSLADLNTINESDGVGGVNAQGLVRIAGGVSLLDGTNSVLLGALIQEAFRAPGFVKPGQALSEAGLTVRVDLARSFSLQLDGVAGFAPSVKNDALNLTDQTYHLEVGGFLRKTFGNGVWLALALSLGRDSHRVEYLDSKNVYNTIDAPHFAAAIVFGVALWRAP